MPTRTDVHIVSVDDDSLIRNLLKVRTVRCALVLYDGNYSATGHHFFLFHITYLTVLTFNRLRISESSSADT